MKRLNWFYLPPGCLYRKMCQQPYWRVTMSGSYLLKFQNFDTAYTPNRYQCTNLQLLNLPNIVKISFTVSSIWKVIFFYISKASKLTFSIATKQPYLAAKDASPDVSLMAIGSRTKCTKNFFFLKRDYSKKKGWVS